MTRHASTYHNLAAATGQGQSPATICYSQAGTIVRRMNLSLGASRLAVTLCYVDGIRHVAKVGATWVS